MKTTSTTVAPMAETSRLRKIVTIRWTLPLCVIAPLISGIALTSWLAYRSGQQAVEELIDKISLEVTATVEKQVTSYLLEPSVIAAAVKAEVASGNINIADTTELSRDLWQLTRSEQLTQNAYYGNEKGEFVYSQYQDGQNRIDIRARVTNFKRTPYYTDDKGSITKPLPESEYDKSSYDTYDHRQRDWYKNTAEAKLGTWSDVYQARGNGQLTITRATPIFKSNGEIEGIFGTDVYLSELSNFLQDLDLSPNARAFIIDSKDNLIAISSDQPLSMSAAVESTDPLVQETARGLLDEVGSFDSIEQQHMFTFESKGNKQLVHVYRLQEQGIDWLIGVTLPKSDYMGDIRTGAWQTFILGTMITGGASLLALGAALNIVRPINRLTQAAQDIKNNHFDPENLADVIARPDEFSELAILFNDMATVVVSREQSLAEQVLQLKTEIDQDDDSSAQQQIEDIVAQARQTRGT